MQFIRNITKNSTSLCVNVPYRVIKRLGLKIGDEVKFRILPDTSALQDELHKLWDKKRKVKVFFNDDRDKVVGSIFRVDTKNLVILTDKGLYFLSLETINKVEDIQK